MSSKTKTSATKEEARPTLVPKLRFPEFRRVEEWGNLTLGDITTKTDKRNKGGKSHPVYSISNKAGFTPQSEQFEGVDSEKRGYNIALYKLIGPKTFAYNPARINVGSIGYSGDLNDIIISSLYVCFKAKQDADDRFLRHFFETREFERSVNNHVEGGIRSYLFFENFARIRVPLPSIKEQQKIAECLSSVDELTAAQARKVDALKTHKKGLMQQLFPRESETQPRLRFPEFQNAGEWEEATLGQLAKLVRGPFGGSLKKEIFVASGYAVYEQQHAIYSDFSSFRYHITAEKFHELRRFAVAANDIIMSCSGTMGKFAIIPGGVAPGVINQALLKLTPHDFCNTRFLKEILELPSVQQKLLSQSAGGAIQNVVSVDQIKALPLRLPSADEQQAVVGCLSSLDALITLEAQKFEALKTHKKGLMQQLFPSPEEVET